MPNFFWMPFGTALILYAASFGLLMLGERGRCSPFYFAAILFQVGALGTLALPAAGLHSGFAAGWGLIVLAQVTTRPFVETQARSAAPAFVHPPTRNEIWICWAVAGFMVIFATLAFTNASRFGDFLGNLPNHLNFGWKIKPNPKLGDTVAMLGWIVFAPVATAAACLEKRTWVNAVPCLMITGCAWILCAALHLDFSHTI